MTIPALTKAATTSIFEVFETMFFMSIEVSDLPDIKAFKDTLNEDVRVSRLLFDGPIKGAMILCIPVSLLTLLTENFLGETKEQITDTHLNGTINEILNMVTGNTMSHYNDQLVIELATPQIIDFATSLTDGRDGFSLLIKTIDGPCALTISYENVAQA